MHMLWLADAVAGGCKEPDNLQLVTSHLLCDWHLMSTDVLATVLSFGMFGESAPGALAQCVFCLSLNIVHEPENCRHPLSVPVT